MDTYLDYLTQATATLVPGLDPDGLLARQALALAVHAASAANAATDVTAVADWDFYCVSIGEAEQILTADLDPLHLATDRLPPVGPDSPSLRHTVRTLVRRLADLYTGAAAGERGSPWRRLVWASVAYRLDEACRELA
jgi:hypothetical protein